MGRTSKSKGRSRGGRGRGSRGRGRGRGPGRPRSKGKIKIAILPPTPPPIHKKRKKNTKMPELSDIPQSKSNINADVIGMDFSSARLNSNNPHFGDLSFCCL